MIPPIRPKTPYSKNLILRTASVKKRGYYTKEHKTINSVFVTPSSANMTSVERITHSKLGTKEGGELLKSFS